MNLIKTFGLLLLIMISSQSVFADLKLDNTYFDPAIISAGDEVDIVVQFHDESSPVDEDKVDQEKYTFEVKIEADDSITEKYILIQDEEGDDLRGRIFTGEYYNKVFRVKVLNDAPAGNYQFKLIGQWYKDGVPLNSFRSTKFFMAVKKEGIILDIASINTIPGEVRAGDNFVNIQAFLENAGSKDSKSIELNLNLPSGIESSYSNNNRIYVGKINQGEKKEINFFIDIDQNVTAGVYDLEYDLDYMDLDDNKYSKQKMVPLLVKSRPYLEVSKVEGEGLSGASNKLYVTIKNTGTESAESVDVRILKQNSQPFNFDIRSDYVGELNPGEEGLAVFELDINSDAEIKDHDFKILIRAKGDSDEGDDNIYTYNRRAKFSVIGEAPNKLKYFSLIGVGIILLFYLVNFYYKRRHKR